MRDARACSGAQPAPVRVASLAFLWLPPRRMEPPIPAALPLVADHPDEARLAPSEWEPGFLEGEGLRPEVYIQYIYIYIYI